MTDLLLVQQCFDEADEYRVVRPYDFAQFGDPVVSAGRPDDANAKLFHGNAGFASAGPFTAQEKY